jgi:hypothetical protein
MQFFRALVALMVTFQLALLSQAKTAKLGVKISYYFSIYIPNGSIKNDSSLYILI